MLITKFKSRLVGSATALLMIFALLPAAPVFALEFADVPAEHWAYTDIQWAISIGCVNGVGQNEQGENVFAPDEEFTRAQFAKVMSTAFDLTGAPDKNGNDVAYSEINSYSDVPQDYWGHEYIEAVQYTGNREEPLMSVSQVPGGAPVFLPEDKATRETIMVTAAKVIGAPEISDSEADNILTEFTDWSSVSPQLKPFVAVSVREGIIKGTTIDGIRYLYPQDGLTRAEGIAVLNRIARVANVRLTVNENPLQASHASEFTISGTTSLGARVFVDDGTGKGEYEVVPYSDGNVVRWNSQTVKMDAAYGDLNFRVRAVKGSSSIIRTKAVRISDDAPPIIRIFSATQPSYNETSATIYGRVADENLSVLRLFFNDAETAFDHVTGDFTCTYNGLRPGSNAYTIKAVDYLNQVTSVSGSIDINVSNPTITLSDATLNADKALLVKVVRYTVSGRVENTDNLYVGTYTSKDWQIRDGGTFGIDLTLDPGYNNITITATNTAGAAVSKKVAIFYDDGTGYPAKGQNPYGPSLPGDTMATSNPSPAPTAVASNPTPTPSATAPNPSPTATVPATPTPVPTPSPSTDEVTEAQKPTDPTPPPASGTPTGSTSKAYKLETLLTTNLVHNAYGDSLITCDDSDNIYYVSNDNLTTASNDILTFVAVSGEVVRKSNGKIMKLNINTKSKSEVLDLASIGIDTDEMLCGDFIPRNLFYSSTSGRLLLQGQFGYREGNNAMFSALYEVNDGSAQLIATTPTERFSATGYADYNFVGYVMYEYTNGDFLAHGNILTKASGYLNDIQNRIQMSASVKDDYRTGKKIYSSDSSYNFITNFRFVDNVNGSDYMGGWGGGVVGLFKLPSGGGNAEFVWDGKDVINADKMGYKGQKIYTYYHDAPYWAIYDVNGNMTESFTIADIDIKDLRQISSSSSRLFITNNEKIVFYDTDRFRILSKN